MDGKVITITGGASGQGLALVKLLAARNARLSIADVSTRGLDALKAELNADHPDYLYTQVDISKEQEVNDWITNTKRHFGRLDGAANCAGTVGTTYTPMPVSQMDTANWHRCLDVNLTGTMYCLRAQLQNIEDGGSIVSVASIAGLEGLPDMGQYCAAKHGVIGLSRGAAKEVGSRGIRVNVMAPGNIDTPMLHEALGGRENVRPATAMPRYGTPTEAAYLLAWLLGPESTFVSGSVYTLDGGWHC